MEQRSDLKRHGQQQRQIRYSVSECQRRNDYIVDVCLETRKREENHTVGRQFDLFDLDVLEERERGEGGRPASDEDIGVLVKVPRGTCDSRRWTGYRVQTTTRNPRHSQRAGPCMSRRPGPLADTQ